MAELASSRPGDIPWVDPRVERSRTVILSAALALLGEMGYGGLTIEAVAARAGVGKSTVYRHWSGKLELVEDAIRTLKAGVTVPAAGSVRDRLVDVLRQIAQNMAASTWSSCLPAIIDAAERDPEVLDIQRRLSRERRQLIVDLLAEGRATGEVPDVDLTLLAECLVGPIVVRRLLLHEPFAPDAVPRLVDQLLPPGEEPPGRRGP
ncbi:MAG TPA: TetR/AcrR family transcriptional regulator [Acidimicrobiales bacterium]|nr:TetR/AcrR family transcriptional regulator [Acidimicrobiales bacterium]